MIKGRISDTKETNNTILDIILDDNDEVIECIEQAFLQNNIKKAHLILAVGSLRNIRIATTRAGVLKQKEYNENCLIKNVSGTFTKIKENEYMGDFNISIAKSNMATVSGVLLKGYASGEVKISFKVISEMSIGAIVTPSGTQEITLVKQKMLDEIVPKKPKKEMIIG